LLSGALLAIATLVAPGLASATPPANGEPPTLSGDALVGSTLYATAGRWSGVPAPTYSYRWQYQTSNGNWPDIAGATGPTYEIRPEDLGYPLRVNVTATNSDGSAEQISVATAAVKNPPVTPVVPPPPPVDVLGTPANSRVVSADGVFLGVDVRGSENHERASQTLVTNRDGALAAPPAELTAVDTGADWPHFLPTVSVAGRFADQNSDTVLTLRNGYDSTNRDPAGHSLHFALTPDSLLKPNTPGEPQPTLQAGKTFWLLPGHDTHTAVTEDNSAWNEPNAKVNAVDFQKDVGDAASWTAVALPAAGADVVALVNHRSGRCLGIPADNNPNHAAFSYDCQWGSMPAEQQWTSPLPNALVNKADGLALTAGANGLVGAPFAENPRAPEQGWLLFNRDLAHGGDEVPAYGFSTPDVMTYTMAAGDLDRESVYGDVFMYHDEAAIAWVEDSRTPAPPQIRVVDYASTGVIAPAPVDLATRLPAPGLLKQDPNDPGVEDWYSGSLGLAAGDFDGDSLNELAYTWQDAAGTFHVTMLEYRAAPDGTRSLNVVGPVDGLSLFAASGAPTPDLDAGMAETKAGDFDGDGRDDLAITFAATPNGGGPLTGYLGVVSFTQDLGIRGQQFAPYTQDPLYVDADGGAGPGVATRGLRVAPGLFRFDPEVGYTMERRQLATAWTEQSGAAMNTYVGVLSVDPDPSCTQTACSLAINTVAPRQLVHSAPEPADTMEYALPLAFTAGGLRGRGATDDVPIWGIALVVDDVGEDLQTPPSTRLFTLAVNEDANADGFSVSVLDENNLWSWPGGPQLYTATAYDPTGASLMLGAPAVMSVQQLKRATLVAAQPPVHADWNWELTDPESGEEGAFINASRFSEFAVTLGSTSTKTYQHTYKHTTGWNGGLNQSLDVKGSFNNDLGVEATTASVEFKEKFSAKWTGSGSDFNNSESETSIGLTQTSNDDDLFQGVVENSTLYRYPILGGPVKNADGTPVEGAECGQTCYGVYEVVIPGEVTPINTSGRSVDFYQPTWENGNALSYPTIDGGQVPTPDLGAYSYVDDNGTTQAVTAPLLTEIIGVGGSSAKATLEVTGTRGSGNSSSTGNSWNLSTDVKASASYRIGPKAVNYKGSVAFSIGGFGGQNTSTSNTGKTIDTTAASFEMDVPEIQSDNGYEVGTAYYYDSGGAARVSMAVDLTADAAGKDWWTDNYGREPDPALNLPNRTILTWDKYTNEQILPAFVTSASHQQIRGFRAVHTADDANPTFANQDYTTNPVAGDAVVFQTPVRNYSLVPVSNVTVSFYAVPMEYEGAVEVVAGPPQPIGAPQVVDQIPAQGSVNVASPVWKAAVQSGVEGIQPWRIFVVLDEKNAVAEIHEWKDDNGACPKTSLEPQPANGTVINGVMVDPMTGKASILACGQNNQGFGEIAVSATAGTDSSSADGVMTVLDMAGFVEEGAPGVELTAGGVLTDDPATTVLERGEIARVARGEEAQVVAYVGARGESLHHQTVMVYDGPPDTGELVAVTTLRGATAADGHRVAFTWRPEEAGKHTLYVKLLGHQAAGEDDLLTIPFDVGASAAGAPTGLTAAVAPSAGVGAQQVELTWNLPISNGGSRIRDYVVQRSTDGRTWTTVDDGVSAKRRALVGRLTNGTRYRFRVAAVNAAGQGPWSVPVEAAPRWRPSATGRPTAAVAPAPRVASRQVALSWSLPASNGGSRITDYVIQRSLDGRTWTTVNDGVSAKRRAVVGRLSNGTRYRFRVAAVNGVGQGPWSATVRATPRWTPTAPYRLTTTAGSRQVRLRWSVPTSNRGARITDYVVQYSRSGRAWTTVHDGHSTRRVAIVRRLNDGDPYLFRVAATNAAGRSPWSRTILAIPGR
jgi:hypothetical protein